MKIYNIVKIITLKGKPQYVVVSCNLSEIIKVLWRWSHIFISIKDVYNYISDENIYFSKHKAKIKTDEINNSI